MRELPLTPETLQALARYVRPGEIYLFGPRAGGPVDPGSATKAMPRLCKAAGVPPMGLHDLRSYAASNLRALGCDPWEIMEILGHSDIDTTTIYVDADDEGKRKALGGLLKRLLPPPSEEPLEASGGA